MTEQTTNSTPYAFGVRVPFAFDEAVGKVKDALKEQGFGVLTEIDVQRTLKEKLDHEMGRYLILGACNPQLARRGLMAEKELGVLLPCNVVLYEDAGSGGDIVVIAQDPQPMLGMVGNPALGPMATEARERLQRALASLGGTPR